MVSCSPSPSCSSRSAGASSAFRAARDLEGLALACHARASTSPTSASASSTPDGQGARAPLHGLGNTGRRARLRMHRPPPGALHLSEAHDLAPLVVSPRAAHQALARNELVVTRALDARVDDGRGLRGSGCGRLDSSLDARSTKSCASHRLGSMSSARALIASECQATIILEI